MLPDAVIQRLRARFDAAPADFCKRRIVFWRDEAGEFADDIDLLDIAGVKLVKLTGRNNFAVKKLLEADDPSSNYIVYDPLKYKDDHSDDWLLDVRLYSGREFFADRTSLLMDDLNIVPEAGLELKVCETVRLYDAFFRSEDHREKLKKIGRGYSTPTQIHTDAMAVLCGLDGGTPQDIIIAVLSAGLDKGGNQALGNIEKYGNTDVFWRMADVYVGYTCGADRPLQDLAAHVLFTAMAHTTGDSLLKGLERFVSNHDEGRGKLGKEQMELRKTHGERCCQIVRDWQRGADRERLEEVCREVEQLYHLANRFDDADMGTLLKCDVFPAINESILRRFFAEIGGQKLIRADDILKAVENRRLTAWYNLTKSHFDCLYYIAQMQRFYAGHSDGFHVVEASSLWNLYTSDAFEMDSHYRHACLAYGEAPEVAGSLFPDSQAYGDLKDGLRKCMDTVEDVYHNWFLKSLTEAWCKAIAGDMGKLGHVSQLAKQRDFYEDYVAALAAKNHPVFVVISDALRFEVAAELAETLNRETRGVAELKSVQAVFPTATQFGMAALLPGREIALTDKLDVLVDGMPTVTTENREEILKARNPNSLAITYKKLDQMGRQARREWCNGAEVVYVFHDAIDAAGDNRKTEANVFKACGTAVAELTKIVKIILNDMNRSTIFITADHGFLYTHRPLEESDKISRETFGGGEVYKLDRRYALAAPQTTADHMMPVDVGHEVGGRAVQGFAPLGTIRIKVQGGGENYVHGGVSLQEMVAPVIAYKGTRRESPMFREVQNPGLGLMSSTRRASNMIFSLDFWQKLPVGDKVKPCEYSVCFVDDMGLEVSDTQTVTADRTGENATERVFQVRFTLKQMSFDRHRLYRLVISNGVDVPEEAEFHIDIAFADDFGFNL